MLSESEVAEIEREPWMHSYDDDRLNAPVETRRVGITVAQRDALCQTVRGLRAENARLVKCEHCAAEAVHRTCERHYD